MLLLFLVRLRRHVIGDPPTVVGDVRVGRVDLACADERELAAFRERAVALRVAVADHDLVALREPADPPRVRPERYEAAVGRDRRLAAAAVRGQEPAAVRGLPAVRGP